MDWISVDERLPEEVNVGYSVHVLMFSKYHGQIIGYRYTNTWEAECLGEDYDPDNLQDITHWMPLPEPPITRGI